MLVGLGKTIVHEYGIEQPHVDRRSLLPQHSPGRSPCGIDQLHNGTKVYFAVTEIVAGTADQQCAGGEIHCRSESIKLAYALSCDLLAKRELSGILDGCFARREEVVFVHSAALGYGLGEVGAVSIKSRAITIKRGRQYHAAGRRPHDQGQRIVADEHAAAKPRLLLGHRTGYDLLWIVDIKPEIRE